MEISTNRGDFKKQMSGMMIWCVMYAVGGVGIVLCGVGSIRQAVVARYNSATVG